MRGDSCRRLAARYGLSYTAVHRHAKAHLPPALVELTRERAGAGVASAQAQLAALVLRVEALLAGAERDGSKTQAIAAASELRRCFELQAKITGELDERNVQAVNVLVAPEWLLIRAAITEALLPYPEARLAVSGRLRALESAQS